MVILSESRRLAAALIVLDSEVRAAKHDVALLEKLAIRLSRLAAEITLACERSFIVALEAAA